MVGFVPKVNLNTIKTQSYNMIIIMCVIMITIMFTIYDCSFYKGAQEHSFHQFQGLRRPGEQSISMKLII